MKRLKTLLATGLLTVAVATSTLAQTASVFATTTDSSTSTTTSTTSDSTSTSIASSYSTGGNGYVRLGSTFSTQTVSAGQAVTLVIPIVNYNYTPITDVVVTPQVSNLATEWPFKIDSTGYTQSIPYISANSANVDPETLRADLTYNFTVRSDAYTGYYPLNFDISYTIDDTFESTTLTAYIYVNGTAGDLDGTSSSSKPRIIVTGFETDPEKVCAGDTFTLTVHVKNTSASTAVTNVLFDLQADQETTTSGTTTSYDAFLPTSGSSSIYESSIAAGETKDLQIEMTARADLTQKPYVLSVNMTYDAGSNVDITDTASVSVPVYQESKFDTGEEDIMSDYLMVGEEGNISFSIYNTGRTTLNNVWFRFQDETVEGEDVYVGTISSGATGYVDATFTAMDVNEGTVTAVIEYEDEAGNVTSVEKTFEIYISEYVDYSEYDDYDYDDYSYSTGLPTWAKVLIGVGIVAVLVIVLLVLKKKELLFFKKKKNEEDFDEDFDEDGKE